MRKARRAHRNKRLGSSNSLWGAFLHTRLSMQTEQKDILNRSASSSLRCEKSVSEKPSRREETEPYSALVSRKPKFSEARVPTGIVTCYRRTPFSRWPRRRRRRGMPVLNLPKDQRECRHLRLSITSTTNWPRLERTQGFLGVN